MRSADGRDPRDANGDRELGEPCGKPARGKPVYRLGRLHASYLHLYFPSNPETTARLFAP